MRVQSVEPDSLTTEYRIMARRANRARALVASEYRRLGDNENDVFVSFARITEHLAELSDLDQIEKSLRMRGSEAAAGD